MLKRSGVDEAELTSANTEISQADGSKMEILRTMDWPVGIGKLRTIHRIYMSSSLDREVVIGGNWLKKYNAVIYCRLSTLRKDTEEILHW